jgi:hypothetical protein
MPMNIVENVVRLNGLCAIEEAEALHQALCGMERPIFDLTEAAHLHAAIVQLIMASGGMVRGLPTDLALAACLRDRIASS